MSAVTLGDLLREKLGNVVPFRKIEPPPSPRPPPHPAAPAQVPPLRPAAAADGPRDVVEREIAVHGLDRARFGAVLPDGPDEPVMLGDLLRERLMRRGELGTDLRKRPTTPRNEEVFTMTIPQDPFAHAAVVAREALRESVKTAMSAPFEIRRVGDVVAMEELRVARHRAPSPDVGADTTQPAPKATRL
jgi:hypothetical protein